MKTTILQKIFASLSFAALILLTAAPAYADTTQTAQPPAANSGSTSSQITYPIPQLGDCSTRDDCRKYCDQVANMQSCIVFGENHGLITQNQANSFLGLAKDISNGKVHTPEDCKNAQSCKEVCEHSASATVIAQCVKLGEETGTISKSDAARAQAFLQLLQQGKTPGGCTSKDACEAYCQDSAHAQACMAFFLEMENLIPGSEKTAEEKQQLESMDKFEALLQQGKTPGGCTDKNSCQTYCQNQSHFQECADFAKAMGFVNPEQAQKLEQSGGKGPGGCDSEDSCAAFCNQPQNQQTCINFGQQTGTLNSSDASKIEDAQQGLKHIEQNSHMPDWVKNCLEQSLGSDAADKISQGDFVPGPQDASKIGQCMQQANPNFQDQSQMPMQTPPQTPPQMPPQQQMQQGSFEQQAPEQEQQHPEMMGGDQQQPEGQQSPSQPSDQQQSGDN